MPVSCCVLIFLFVQSGLVIWSFPGGFSLGRLRFLSRGRGRHRHRHRHVRSDWQFTVTDALVGPERARNETRGSEMSTELRNDVGCELMTGCGTGSF